MADPPEPNGSQFNDLSVQGHVDIKLPEIATAAAQVGALVTNLTALHGILQRFSSMSGSGLNTLLTKINTQATAAAGAVAQLANASASISSPGTGTSSNTSTTYTAAPGAANASTAWVQQATQQASQSTASRMPGGIAAASQYLKGTDSLGGGLVMGGLRFLRDRIATSRNLAMQSSTDLSLVARQQGSMDPSTRGHGARIEDLMKSLSQFPGNIQGTPEDLLSLFRTAPQLGASFDFMNNNKDPNRAGRQGPRAAGMLAGVREAQLMNPGESVSSIVNNIGGFASNIGAQQTGAFLTGGAFSMIKAGGRQKSLSEWAEDILKWLQNLRAGSERGQPFNYGQLMAQYFPGSNIDAWFNANGVTQEMKNYWWTYVLEKAQKVDTGQLQIGQPMEIKADVSNLSYQRLQATSELTRTEFNLGGQMMGAFNNKEQANRWFNAFFGKLQTNLIPLFARTIGKFVEFLPDTIEELMMGGIEGIAAGDVSGDTTWGVGDPDIGDAGWGSLGGTGLGSLSPNMRSKLGPMLQANPKLKINSGLRDNNMQKRLKAQGHTRVSGKPSAHTRGDAADLGPASQYGWLAKNASKFGLKSGVGEGEPWHVGVGDIGDDAWDMFSDVTGFLDKGASGLMDLVKWLFNNLFQKIPGFGSLGSDSSAEVSSSDDSDKFYQSLIDANKGMTLGGKAEGLPSRSGSSNSGTTSNTSDQPYYGPGAPTHTPGVSLPAGGAPNTPEAGVAAATALFNAGFRTRQDLETITAISWRESRWNPQSKNKDTSDRGLMQINMSAHKDTMAQMGYDEQDLLDIQKNANIAYRLWQEEGGNYGAFKQLWGFSEHSPYSEPVHGRPGWDGKNGDPLGRTQGSNAAQIVASSGLPVIGDLITAPVAMDMMRYQMPTTQTDKQSITFHNTFHIGNTGDRGGGIDVRHTVTRVADLLEDEMDRRLSRNN